MKAAGLAVLDVDSCAHLVRILDGGLTRNMLWAGIVWAGSACEAASLAEHEAVAITNTGNWAIRVRPVCGDEGLHVAGGSGRCSAPELAQELGALFSEGRSVASALRAMLSQHEQWRAGELFELLRFGLGIPFHEACMVFRWDGVGSEGVDDGQLDAVLNGHMANALGARSSDTGDSH